MVFFIGAGVSRLMGVPGWDEFSDRLIIGAYKNYKERQMILENISNSKEKITIAYRKYCNTNREQDFFNAFGRAFKVKKQRTNIYQLLSKFHAIFLTTNADDLFEKELGSALCHSELELQIIKEENFIKTNHLFYLHSKYQKGKGKKALEKNRKIVFTASSYVEKYNDPITINFLQTLFDSTCVVVFVGYGLNEFELIDYIMTKTNKNPAEYKNVYTLEGFFSNQDDIFQARKEYFSDLGIDLLPYCLDEKGYETLYDVLGQWLNEFYKRANLPALMHSDIETYGRKFTPENAAQVTNIVNTEPNTAIKNKIVKEVLISKDKDERLQYFLQKELYSVEEFEKIIESGNREWEYLEFLIVALQNANSLAQDIGVRLIDGIIRENIQFKQENIFIASRLVQVVFLLDGEHIKKDYFTLVKKLIKLYGYLYVGEKHSQNLI